MADLQRRVTKSGEVRWDVRYRDDARQQRKRSFERKLDAQRFARSVETDLLRGDWIDPRRGQELFDVWAAMWMETLASRKPKTRESYESIVHRHLLPRFAATPIAAIDYPCVLVFVAGLQRQGLGAGTARHGGAWLRGTRRRPRSDPIRPSRGVAPPRSVPRQRSRA